MEVPRRSCVVPWSRKNPTAFSFLPAARVISVGRRSSDDPRLTSQLTIADGTLVIWSQTNVTDEADVSERVRFDPPAAPPAP